MAEENDDLAAQVGAALRSWRTGNRLAREYVAPRVGVSVSTIVRWERGEGGGPRMGEIIRMERVSPGIIAAIHELVHRPEKPVNGAR